MAKIDLINQRFGKLIVLYELEKIKYTRYWLCLCDCGNKVRVAQGNLRKGTSRSCGCNRINNGKTEDLTSKVFGRLTAIKRIGTSNRYALWECTCICGNVKRVTSADLRSGNTQSCGCLKKDNFKLLEKNAKKHMIDGVKIPLLKKKMPNTKTGVKGVHEILRPNGRIKYIAAIGIKGEKFYLGTYNTLEEATQARIKGEEKYHLPYLTKAKKDNK